MYHDFVARICIEPSLSVYDERFIACCARGLIAVRAARGLYPPVQITRASLLRAPNREFDEKPQNN